MVRLLGHFKVLLRSLEVDELAWSLMSDETRRPVTAEVLNGDGRLLCPG